MKRNCLQKLFNSVEERKIGSYVRSLSVPLVSSERENLQKRREVLFLTCDLHDFGLHLQADAISEKYVHEN